MTAPYIGVDPAVLFPLVRELIPAADRPCTVRRATEAMEEESAATVIVRLVACAVLVVQTWCLALITHARAASGHVAYELLHWFHSVDSIPLHSRPIAVELFSV